MAIARQVQVLLDRGVVIPCPDTVYVDDTVHPERIARGVILHSGSRLIGSEISIGPGSEIGGESPAIVENCQLGHGVSLRGGYYSGATFLDGSSLGSASHVRPGTLLEEASNGAHAVGLKQTIFFPYVTAGSLINFCDVLMAGGRSRKNHSEIGSSYIHFNFTPHQDKATASLIGDVPRGVLLDQAPIFLGGQGGLAGPSRIAYGTVIPAGTICRGDVLVENQLYSAPAAIPRDQMNFVPGMYRAVNRILANNLIYIGSLWALREWYIHARKRMMSGDPYREACWAGAIRQIGAALDERLRRLAELAGKMPASLELARRQFSGDPPDNPFAQQRAFSERWPAIYQKLEQGPDAANRSRMAFMDEWEQIDSSVRYLDAIATLGRRARLSATGWLQEVVDSAASLWTKL